MKEQFCSYEIALKLKELGFNEECLAIYTHNNQHYDAGAFFLHTPHPFTIEELTPEVQDIRESAVYILAPLWQQAIDWFREKHNLAIELDRQFDDSPNNIHNCELEKDTKIFFTSFINNGKEANIIYNGSFYNAREQAILKAIELIK